MAVYFTLPGKPMSMARDSYWDISHNLRSSLSAAIEHLRGLERHGGAQTLERAFNAGFRTASTTGWSGYDHKPLTGNVNALVRSPLIAARGSTVAGRGTLPGAGQECAQRRRR